MPTDASPVAALAMVRYMQGVSVMFTSAYKSLRPAEKAFVDGYVQRLEREQAKAHERISNALYRPVPQDVIDGDTQGMLARPMVIAAVTERINQIAADSELSAHRIIKEYMAVGFASLGDFMEVNQFGEPSFALDKATPEQISAIKKIKIKELMNGRREFELELHSKLDALGVLATFAGLKAPDSPHWREMNARPVAPAAIEADATVEDAGERYARAIADG